MNIFEAIRQLIDEGSAPKDFFDGMRTVTEMTGHTPFGMIWLDVSNYAPRYPGDVGLFGVEWLPFEPDMPKEDIITVLETLVTTLKNNQERRYGDE